MESFSVYVSRHTLPSEMRSDWEFIGAFDSKYLAHRWVLDNHAELQRDYYQVRIYALEMVDKKIL